jgi:hypothetical protein
MATQLLKPKIELIAENYKLPYLWREQKTTFIFPSLNNSEILLRSAEIPQRIEGGQYSWIWIDEPAQCKPQIWNRVITRLNDTRAIKKQIFTTGTPEGYNWYYKEVYRVDENNNPLHRIIRGSIDEIRLNAGEDHIQRLKDNFDSLTLQEKLEGIFIDTTTGRAFYAFNDDCIIGEYQPNYSLGLVVSCDFNINPCVWNLHQMDGDMIYTFDEIVMYHAYTQAMCNDLLAYLENHDFPAITFYGDYTSVHQRGTATSTTDWKIIESNFMNYPNYDKVLKSNPKVKNRVATQNLLLEHGKHKITKNCKFLIDDFKQVIWSDNGHDLDKSDKKRTHACDGTGYFVNAEFGIDRNPSYIV